MASSNRQPEPSTEVVSTSGTPSSVNEIRSASAESSGSTTPVLNTRALQYSVKPLAQFSEVSQLLVNGLLGLTHSFLEKSFIQKEKHAKEQASESTKITSDLFAKQAAFNRLGGLIARSDIHFEDAPLSDDEIHELKKLKLNSPGKNLVQFFAKEEIQQYIKKHVAEKYQGIFLGEEKSDEPALMSLSDAVFNLVELLARPVEILEHEKKIAKQMNRMPRLSEIDLCVNTAKNALNQQIKKLIALKGSTSKADELIEAYASLLGAVKVINIIYAEKGTAAAVEEKHAKLRIDLENLILSDQMQKNLIEELQHEIMEQQTLVTNTREQLGSQIDVLDGVNRELTLQKEALKKANEYKGESDDLIHQLESDLADAKNAVLDLSQKNEVQSVALSEKVAELEPLLTRNQEMTGRIEVLLKTITKLQTENKSLTEALNAVQQEEKSVVSQPVVNHDQYQLMLVQNQALQQQIAHQNALIQQSMNIMVATAESNWIKWTGMGVLTLVGVAMVASGFGALGGIGILAHIAHSTAIALSVTGALTSVGTVVKGITDILGATSSLQQNIQELQANMKPSLDEKSFANGPFQHIDNLLKSEYVMVDAPLPSENALETAPVSAAAQTSQVVQSSPNGSYASFFNALGMPDKTVARPGMSQDYDIENPSSNEDNRFYPAGSSNK